MHTYLCPSPGLAVEPKETVKNSIENLYVLKHDFSLARLHLSEAKSELSFWKVRLSDVINENHEKLTQELKNIYVVIDCLNHNLGIFYLKENNNFTLLIREK